MNELEEHSIRYTTHSRRPLDRLTTIGWCVKEQPRWNSMAMLSMAVPISSLVQSE